MRWINLAIGVLFFWGFTAQARIQSVSLQNDQDELRIEVLTDLLVHFEYSGIGISGAILTSPMVAQSAFPGPTQWKESGSQTRTVLQTSALRIEVEHSTLCADYFEDAIKLTRICPKLGAALELDLTRESTQNLYGLGEEFFEPSPWDGNWLGKVRDSPDPMGNALPQFHGGYTENAQFPILYALGPGLQNYALFLDHAPKIVWDFRASPWRITTTGESLRGYLMGGADLPSLRSQYMDLVGHPPVPPKKMLGLWVSEYYYRNWADLEGKLASLRQHHFPVDGFVLDASWFGGFLFDSPDSPIGRLSWDETSFPDHDQEIQKLWKSWGVGLATIQESYVALDSSGYPGLEKDGALVRGCATCPPTRTDGWWGQGGMIDWTNTGGADRWYDDKIQPLVDSGILVQWTDMGEPEIYSDQDWYSGVPGVSGHGEGAIHNLFNLEWAATLNRGYLRHGIARRPFILTRSGAPGIQRYSTALWSGDIGSNMPSLTAHQNAQIEMSLSGIDYFGSDIGGFHRDGLEGDMGQVYTRWFAHSSLLDVPVRPHTIDGDGMQMTPPDRIGDVQSNLANLRQRYELAPYYYSLAYRAYLEGEPVVPPLVYYNQTDSTARAITDEKTVGKDLLVALSTNYGQNERDVYLPAGDWIEYHDLKWFHSHGDRYSKIPTFRHGLLQLPVFVRAGAILPKMLVDDQTMNLLGARLDGSREDDFRIQVFASSNPSTFDVYEDDGQTQDYLSGRYSWTRVSQELRGTSDLIRIDPVQGSYPLPDRSYWVDAVFETGNWSEVELNGASLPKFNSCDDLRNPANSGWCLLSKTRILARSPKMAASAAKLFKIVAAP